MCLIKLKNLNNRKYTYVQKKFWKVLYIDKRYNKIESPIHCNYKWTYNWNHANRIVENNTIVENSIHVFSKKESAENFIKGYSRNYVILPVYANGEDLVAYGKFGHAAFSKVFFKKEDYERVMRLCES